MNIELAGQHLNLAVEPIAAIQGGQHRVKGGVVGLLQARGVEPLGAQPQFMLARPSSAALIDDPLAQQQCRHAVPCAHQVTAAILACTHHVTGGFLLHGRNGHRHDLTQMQ